MTYPSEYQVIAGEARKCAEAVNRSVGLIDSSYDTSRAKLQQYSQRYNDAACAYDALHQRRDTNNKTEHARKKEMQHLKEKMIAFQESLTAGEREFLHLAFRELK